MTRLSLQNPIAVLMACIALVVFAAVVTPRMSVDTFPELTPPVLVIGTLAPGLGPKDVEKTISWRLEKYVSATPGVDHVESISRNNLSVIYVWLKWGTNLNSSQTLVQQQVAFAMAAVPKSLGVLPPFVLQYDPSNAPLVQVAVTGGGLSGPQLYDYAFNHIEPILEGIPGVASAAVDGGRQRQINVVVDRARAQARGVTSTEVAQAVSRSNALLPSGEMIARRFDANVYTNAVPPRVAQIGEAVVKINGDRPVYIEDVARVEDGGSPETQTVSVGGQDAVLLNVLRVPGGNTLEIVDAVKAAVRDLKDLPPGVKVSAYFDQSTFVRSTYHGLKKEIAQALVLIAIVILIFLQSVRGTVIVAVAVPLSFAITLIVLYASGQTLNAFTLGGLTLAMGPLIDESIVVLESIHRQRAMGLGARQAALGGAGAVAIPVFASTLATMAVLLPVLLLAGLAKKLFAPLALTVAVAMISAYFVSFSVTPVACRYFLGHAERGRLARRLEALIARLADGYVTALRRVLPHRFAVLFACTVLVAASAAAAVRLPSTFFPEIDESMDQIYVRLSPGISLTDATARMQEMGRVLSRQLPGGAVDLVLTNVGVPGNARSAIVSPNVGPHTGFIRLAFADPEQRRLSQQQLADRAREILNREFPGVEVLQYPGGLVASVFANGYIAPLVVEVRGDKLEDLDAQAVAVADVARSVPGIRDIRSSLQLDYPEVRVDADRKEAGRVGVTARDIAQTTIEATLGNINTPSVWIDSQNGQSYYVVTSYDGQRLTDPNALAELPVRVGPQGRAVTLSAYAHLHRSMGPILIERNHLERAAHVLMQTEGRDLGTAASDLEAALAKDPHTRDLRFHFVGQVELMRTTFAGLGLALGLAVMVVFMIMASQFKSIRLPFVMLFTIPVSLTGIVTALMAAGQGFSITALMGILMVIGIAVSNGILLVDAANRHLAEGMEKAEAILMAARARFVPILMTSLATVIGLLPAALALEHGAEANQPLALAVVGGLTSSTMLSLFLIPVMFVFFARRPVPEAPHGAPGWRPPPAVAITLALGVFVARPAGAQEGPAPAPPPSPPLSVAAPPSMTLLEALAYARSHVPLLRGALARVRALLQEARVARAQWLPQLGGTAQVFLGTANNTTASYLNVPEVDLPRIGATRSVTDVRLSPYGSTLAAVSLSQEVIDFGRIAAQAAVADAQAEAAQAEGERVRLEVDVGVEEGFGAVQTAHQILAAAEDAWRRAVAHRDLADARVKSGLSPPVDLTRASAELAAAEVRRTRARLGLVAARSAYAATMGSEALEIDAAGDPSPAAAASPGLAEALDLARARNPAVLAALARVRAAEAQTRAIGRELLPNVLASAGLSGRAGGATPTTGGTDVPYGSGWLPDVLNWHAGLVLQWNLFDATVLARRDASIERVNQARAELDTARLATVLAVERAYLDLQGSVQSIPGLAEAVSAARANQAQAEARFRAGLGTAIELADADALLVGAEVELAVGRFRVERSRAELARAIGKALDGSPAAPAQR